MLKSFVCIVCPNGCEITAELADGKLVSLCGALCDKGRDYVTREITNPMRTISTLVAVRGGELPLTSVRLDAPIPKARIFDAMEEIKRVSLDAPVRIGQVALPGVCGCESNFIVTKNVLKGESE